MKTTLKATLAMLALSAAALAINAQDTSTPSGDKNGPLPQHHRLPPPAIIGAIDANHDGVIDAGEIANASAVLKALDKNGDGVLTPDEFDGRGHRPPPPPDDANVSGPDGGSPQDNLPPGPPPDDE